MDAYLFSYILFFLVLGALIFVPDRIMLLLYIIVCNLDVPGVGNFIKIFIIPLIILYRFNKKRTFLVVPKMNLSHILWIGFTLYALISITWSQTGNYLAGLKFVSSLIGIMLFYQVFKSAYSKNLVGSKFLTYSVLITLLLGISQTFLLDSRFGVQYDRFTGFVASQQYAAFLVGLLCLVLWQNEYTKIHKGVLSFILIVALTYNGSRTWFIGMVIVLTIFILNRCIKSSLRLGLLLITSSIVLIIGVLLFNYAINNQEKILSSSSNRLVEGFYTVFGDNDVKSGTFSFREVMNSGMLNEIKNSTLHNLFFGHGASSSEYVGRKYYPYQFDGLEVDANRVAHNEWLRLFYEFGIVGYLILLYFAISFVKKIIIGNRRLVPIIAYSMGFSVAFSTENVLMGASNVVLAGIIMLLASSYSNEHNNSIKDFSKTDRLIVYR